MLPGSNFPRICKAWKAKHWQGSNVPEFPKALASMRSADLLETHPCRCLTSGFTCFWEVRSPLMFSDLRLPSLHDPPYRNKLGWISGEGGLIAATRL